MLTNRGHGIPVTTARSSKTSSPARLMKYVHERKEKRKRRGLACGSCRCLEPFQVLLVVALTLLMTYVER